MSQKDLNKSPSGTSMNKKDVKKSASGTSVNKKDSKKDAKKSASGSSLNKKDAKKSASGTSLNKKDAKQSASGTSLSKKEEKKPLTLKEMIEIGNPSCNPKNTLVPVPPVWQGKTYKLDKSVNFEEYMLAMGFGAVLRKMLNSLCPEVSLSVDKHDNYTLKFETPFKTITTKFKLDKMLNIQTIDGRTVRTMYTLIDNTLVEEQQGIRPTTIIREFSPDELITLLCVGDIQSVRTYKLWTSALE